MNLLLVTMAIWNGERKREMNMLKCNADIKISHDSHYVPTHKRNDIPFLDGITH
jgi:hypothetical protein